MSFSSLSEYFSSIGEKEKEYTLHFFSFMEKGYPNLSPRLSFSMPMCWVGEKMRDGYVGVSATKSRFTLHFSSEEYPLFIKEEKPDFIYGKRCVSIKYGNMDDLLFLEKKAESFLVSILIAYSEISDF